jgi:hypothetical protein
MSLEEAIRTKLTTTKGPVSYTDLLDHLARDAVFVVELSLSLVECGVAVAMDDVARVEGWIASGELRKPSQAERDTWPLETGREWSAVVVHPFVLLQDPVPTIEA